MYISYIKDNKVIIDGIQEQLMLVCVEGYAKDHYQ